MGIPELSDPRSLDRRQFLALGVGAFVLGGLGLTFARGRALHRRSLPVMGTIAEIAVLHRDRRHAQAAIEAALDELRRVERTMTRFSPSSDVGRANLHAFGGPVRIGRATASVLGAALHWADTGGGRFDPGIGKAVALWDIGHRTSPPPPEPVRRLAGRRLYRAIELDKFRTDPLVRFHDPDVAIDLGGIAKGYGVDRAVEALKRWRITDGLVNVGGDLYALGRSADGDPWKIGIRSPLNPSRLAGTIELSDGAVATSGDYLQFFEHAGRRYHHLLDPRTGAPRRSTTHSVTVAAASCMRADAGATAVFGLSEPAASRLLARAAPDARVVRSL